MSGTASGPDVTLVIPVYNTMPYLTRCLASVRAQTIGWPRLQVILIDDGSTDGSSRALDRFAARHRDAVTLVRQANSGGPAAPCNRGLELARGRYVFFLGADDYLAPDALRRLVDGADRWDSDVVLGRVVGVHSRFVNQEVFARTEPELSLFESPLPQSLANTKLFRRELVEEHGLRYPEDMPMASDQPFTLEACYRARRISVLADGEYYYAVRRLDSRSITYAARHALRMDSAERVVGFVAGLIPPGKQRDAVLTRHFQVELAGLLRDDFAQLNPYLQEEVHRRVGRLVRLYLTDEIRPRLDVEARMRLSIAAAGTVEDLREVIRQDAEIGTLPCHEVDGHWYASYPGIAGTPHWLDVSDAADQWSSRLTVTSLGWHRDELVLTARSPRTDLAARAGGTFSVCAAEVPARSIRLLPDAAGTTVMARFAVASLLAGADGGMRRGVVTRLAGRAGAPVRAPRLRSSRPVLRRVGRRWFALTALRGGNGQLQVSAVPLTPRHVAARLGRILRSERG